MMGRCLSGLLAGRCEFRWWSDEVVGGERVGFLGEERGKANLLGGLGHWNRGVRGLGYGAGLGRPLCGLWKFGDVEGYVGSHGQGMEDLCFPLPMIAFVVMYEITME